MTGSLDITKAYRDRKDRKARKRQDQSSEEKALTGALVPYSRHNEVARMEGRSSRQDRGDPNNAIDLARKWRDDAKEAFRSQQQALQRWHSDAKAVFQAQQQQITSLQAKCDNQTQTLEMMVKQQEKTVVRVIDASEKSQRRIERMYKDTMNQMMVLVVVMFVIVLVGTRK
ncbi:hypothetical protein OQA88_822 [Cercophora sp. LCS_1]